jgi:hypothetical protein
LFGEPDAAGETEFAIDHQDATVRTTIACDRFAMTKADGNRRTGNPASFIILTSEFVQAPPRTQARRAEFELPTPARALFE